MLRSKNNNLIWNGSGPRLETGHPVIGYGEMSRQDRFAAIDHEACGQVFEHGPLQARAGRNFSARQVTRLCPDGARKVKIWTVATGRERILHPSCRILQPRVDPLCLLILSFSHHCRMVIFFSHALKPCSVHFHQVTHPMRLETNRTMAP